MRIQLFNWCDNMNQLPQSNNILNTSNTLNLSREHSEMSGIPSLVLRTMTTDVLRERYWHLWLCSHPHFGLPRSWRATLDKSPRARKMRAIRKNEMIRIEKIVVRQRGETLKKGAKYESVFYPISDTASQPKNAPLDRAGIPVDSAVFLLEGQIAPIP